MDSNLLATGIQHHRAGELQQAHSIYRQLLAENPREAAILNLLGAVCIDRGQLAEADDYLAEALRVNPNLPAAHDNLGVLRARQNRPTDAVASYRRAAALDPTSLATRWNLAKALAHNGQHAEGIEVLESIVQAAPRDAGARFELAAALARAGRTEESMAAYRVTLEIEPRSVSACVNLATLCIDRKQFDEAARWSRRALELRPGIAAAQHVLGCALSGIEEYEEAISAFYTALELNPQLDEARYNLGVTLVEARRFAEAIELFRQIVAQHPSDPTAWYHLGSAQLKAGDIAAAASQFDRAIELREDYAPARHSRANLWLLAGRFAEGFAEYEWRLRLSSYPTPPLPWKPWNGEPLAGKSIVLCGEQGIGDTIQGIRYARLLKEQGARVIVECGAALHPLLSRTAGVDAFIATGTPVEADYCVRMMGVPHRLHTTRETMPTAVPYITADPALVEIWRARLGAIDGFKVGIAWQGNPNFPGDRQRSIALKHFAPLARVPGVRLINLQRGPGIEQLSGVSEAWRVVDFGEQVDTTAGAFMDTAAIMQGLDLVITSDTAMPHLAGALGVPVWVALQKLPDWRFLLEGEACPWYPTMRLFRQPQAEDWVAVLQQLAGELAHASQS
jgi:tetratricopeptide (TPR) repeat protein